MVRLEGHGFFLVALWSMILFLALVVGDNSHMTFALAGAISAHRITYYIMKAEEDEYKKNPDGTPSIAKKYNPKR